MKRLTAIIFISAIIFGAFGYWGVFTRAGRRHFDEMAGMVPFFALVIAAVLLLIVFLLLMRIIYLRNKRR